ncbi:unnamed protein product [Soboliphyme baturini]|uniref:Tyrosyl-DNA phosphodiesterase 1 n=1 Tax=Soboliphyme baturini TaxID=241478 RepID=A0A183I9W8_9BILA|nr:unnamed protein product [Soboliphyme baturini]
MRYLLIYHNIVVSYCICFRIYVSPLFPKSSSAKSQSDSDDKSDSCTHFKRDLIEYLCQYQNRNLAHWIEVVREHDMSSAKVYIVASVPGRHTGENIHRWGHMKLRSLLKIHLENSEVNEWPLICQFSSIGSLGASPHNWLLGEFLSSMTSSTSKSTISSSKLKLIFPSVENVRNSLEGYAAGSSLPYNSRVAERQPYLRRYLNQWKCSKFNRDLASPHIKTYLRYNPLCTRVAWMLLTSANLSKAAWGVFEKNGSQLMIRSYELGILFLPHQFVMISILYQLLLIISFIEPVKFWNKN